jgi:hypothetical protein
MHSYFFIYKKIDFNAGDFLDELGASKAKYFG